MLYFFFQEKGAISKHNFCKVHKKIHTTQFLYKRRRGIIVPILVFMEAKTIYACVMETIQVIVQKFDSHNVI